MVWPVDQRATRILVQAGTCRGWRTPASCQKPVSLRTWQWNNRANVHLLVVVHRGHGTSASWMHTTTNNMHFKNVCASFTRWTKRPKYTENIDFNETVRDDGLIYLILYDTTTLRMRKCRVELVGPQTLLGTHCDISSVTSKFLRNPSN